MRRAPGAAGIALVGVVTLLVVARADQQAPFPHEQHAGLFPLCIGCHVGVPEGQRDAFYPEPEQCAGCHDGVDLDTVQWTPPDANEPDPVRFTHPGHIEAARAAGEPELDCSTCHTPAGAIRMAVRAEVEVERCLSCHAHEASQHYVDADCAVCHAPAAETAMGGAWLGSLPYPIDHVRGEFLPSLHGELASADAARCATCHTKERCESCHVNAADVPDIAGLPAAPPSLTLPKYSAHYVTPPSHSAEDFLERHGDAAAVSSCAACHTQNDCAACHGAQVPGPAGSLPLASQVAAPGVLLTGRAPPSHQVAKFAQEHGALAAASPSSCTSCHSQQTCSSCHVAAGIDGLRLADRAGPVFHPDNFMARHSAEAYGRRLECSSCHDVSAFCRACHETSGFGSFGRLGQGFHDAEPLWLLRHGQAARQALESCASCHAQRDCLQCHSTLGSFQVSPHRSDFDAERARKRNPGICFACHITIPGGG